MADNDKTLTNNFGAPVPDNQHALSAGERGPLLLADYFLVEKLAHFDRERVPERVVHAKGAGAFGYFEASADMSAHTRAHLFGAAGRRTPAPGVEPSPDKLLQGRLFSYPDTQRHRLGANYALIPVNCPFSKKVANYQRDGQMRIDANGGSRANFSPSGRGGPLADRRAAEAPAALHGTTGRTEYPQAGRAGDFEQAGLLYRVMREDERARLVANLAGHLRGASREVQQRQMHHFLAADVEYGTRVATALDLRTDDIFPRER